MQGLGLFACRGEAWPGINPRFRGFGGEEGYLHEKVRQNGAASCAIPRCAGPIASPDPADRRTDPPGRTGSATTASAGARSGGRGADGGALPRQCGEIPEADPEIILGQTARQVASPFS